MKNRLDHITLGFAIIMVIVCSSHAQDEAKEFVEAHNIIRKEVGVGPVTWNTTVAEYAQNYAAKRKDDCAMEHSMPTHLGENLANGPDLNATGSVFYWATEKEFFHPDTNTCDEGQPCGHYTQVVWKNSTQIGCARVKCSEGPMYFVICNYYPPGNYRDEKPY